MVPLENQSKYIVLNQVNMFPTDVSKTLCPTHSTCLNSILRHHPSPSLSFRHFTLRLPSLAKRAEERNGMEQLILIRHARTPNPDQQEIAPICIQGGWRLDVLQANLS